MDKYYLHGLAIYPINDKEKLLEKIVSIMKHGILSREKLKEVWNLKSFGNNWNGKDYISLTKINPNTDLNTIVNGETNDYFLFSEGKATLIISDKIEDECEFVSGEHKRMPNEVWIKNFIPSKYIIGLRLPENLILEMSQFLYAGFEEIGFELPIYDEDSMEIAQKIRISKKTL